MKIWTCKIGEVDKSSLPDGSDWPMRQAIAKAYRDITGEEPRYIFSGWGGKLTPIEREIVEGDSKREKKAIANAKKVKGRI